MVTDLTSLMLGPLHEAFVKHFVEACQQDDRIVAACLIGSYARGEADQYSDIDLSLITTDNSFEEFCLQRESFLRSLGDLVFHEDFGNLDISFSIGGRTASWSHSVRYV